MNVIFRNENSSTQNYLPLKCYVTDKLHCQINRIYAKAKDTSILILRSSQLCHV